MADNKLLPIAVGAAAGFFAAVMLQRARAAGEASKRAGTTGGAAARPAGPAAAPAATGATAAPSVAGGAAGADPWILSEGSRGYTLGETTSSAIKVDEVLVLKVPHIRDFAASEDARFENRRQATTVMSLTPRAAAGAAAPPSCTVPASPEGPLGFIDFTSDDSVIIGDIVRKPGMRSMTRAYVRAGPRETLFFDPSNVCAAVVTCGGLCPGLNNVIRELVHALHNEYGVSAPVLGVQNGYWGFWTPDVLPLDAPGRPVQAARSAPLSLTLDRVSDIHHYGGTILGSDRGGNDLGIVTSFIEKYRINQLYVIGGDGTHRGADAIYKACSAKKMPVVVCGLPKTIDNDVDIIDRSFGFDTAVAEAVKAIASAKVEAQGAPNGIGLVKLMGRYAGFIAAHATLASGDVDLCLIPEVPIVTGGAACMMAHLERVLARKKHAVIVVAEGAGEEMLAADAAARGEKIEVDAGGNRKLPPIATWLKSRLADHFASISVPVAIKLIDPSYTIRSVPANPADSIYCTLLAQSAVHGAMAGFTGFSVGLTNNRLVYLPISAITANSPRKLNPRGRTYERVLAITGQPDPLSDPAIAATWKSGDVAKASS